MRQAWSVAGLAIGLGLLAVAALIGFDASTMHVPPVHAKVGPTIFPIAISCGLAIAGAVTIWQSRAGGSFPSAEGDTDWLAVAVIAAGLIVHMNLLKPAGFVPAGIVLFMCVAFAFGSRSFARDALVAVAVVLVTYFGFTRLLGLQLPPGILAGLT